MTTQPAAGRIWGFVSLASWLSSLLLVCAAGCERRPDVLAEKSSDDSDRIRMNLPEDEEPPKFYFPRRLRTRDESLNRFIEQLKQICLEGEYGQYRLKVSRRVEPLSRERFENAWHAVKSVRIRWLGRLEPGAVQWVTAPAPREIKQWLRQVSTRPVTSWPAATQRAGNSASSRPGPEQRD